MEEHVNMKKTKQKVKASTTSKAIPSIIKYRYVLVYTLFPQIEYLVKAEKKEWVYYLSQYYNELMNNKYALNFIKYQSNTTITSHLANGELHWNFTHRLLDSIKMINDFGSKAHITMAMLYQTNNLTKLHARLIKHKDEFDAEAYEEEYAKKIANIQYNQVENDKFVLKILSSVKEFANEGNQLHHCVYKAKYYERKDCVILSARLKSNLDVPIETIEYKPSEKKVIQIRGNHDYDSEWHSEILKLAAKIKNNFTYKQSIAN